MEPALILLGLLFAVGLVLWLLDRLKPHDARTDQKPPLNATAVPAAGCTDTHCALHSVCPSEQIASAACADAAIYYEDEELDAYRGRSGDDYTDTEIELFREVLYTLRPDEVLAWHRSLQRRCIELPTALRDELLLLATDRQTS